jgi:hypothetical protein
VKPGFARHGFPVEKVAAAVDALEAAKTVYATAKASRSAAIRKWTAAMEAALDALVSVDALVANTLKDNPEAMAAYESARTIRRTRGKSAAATAPETPAVPAAANAAVA